MVNLLQKYLFLTIAKNYSVNHVNLTKNSFRSNNKKDSQIPNFSTKNQIRINRLRKKKLKQIEIAEIYKQLKKIESMTKILKDTSKLSKDRSQRYIKTINSLKFELDKKREKLNSY